MTAQAPICTAKHTNDPFSVDRTNHCESNADEIQNPAGYGHIQKHGCWVTPDVDLNFFIEEAYYAEPMNSTNRKHGSATEDLSRRKRGEVFARRDCRPPLTNIEY